MKPVITALLCCCCVTACSVTGQLYPVSGPASNQRQIAVTEVTIRGVTGNSGPADLSLPSGEICKGKWSVVAPRMTGLGLHSGTASVSSGLNNAFVSMHGQSFINVSAPGINKGQAMLVGERGTIIECAFLVGSGTASGYGTATDNKGNVYKLIF